MDMNVSKQHSIKNCKVEKRREKKDYSISMCVTRVYCSKSLFSSYIVSTDGTVLTQKLK